MKNKITWIGGLTAGVLIAISASLLAGSVSLPNTFSAGTPAKASEVNANFAAVKAAVDDNAARVTTLESGAADPNVSGNITLVPSTPSTGNILKGTAPFIHNFGTDNTFIGVNAGNFTMSGGNNTASGVRALANITTGSANTASGFRALDNNTSGNYNTASSYGALQSNTTGSENTATGAQALLLNTTGSYNTASGRDALRNNTTGNMNTANGRDALFGNTTGNGNTASGLNALGNNTTGSNNIAIGLGAGTNLTTGSNNIAIGNVGVAAESSTIRIGTAGNHNFTFIAGIRGVTTANANALNVVIDSAGQLGTVNSSRRVKDHIADMGKASEALMKLRPVTFYYKSDHDRKGRTLQYGLIAEEVAEIAPGLVARTATGEIETVYYQFLAPMLLNEFQKQQHTIEAQAGEIAQLKRQAARMAAALSRLEKREQLASVSQ